MATEQVGSIIMTKDWDDISFETLQQRLVEEVDAQKRLQKELKTALAHERDLRLENELLWVYLQDRAPARVDDAASLLERLTKGSDLAQELQNRSGEMERTRESVSGSRSLIRRTRSAVGKLPGVRRIYHSLKSLGQ